MKLWIFISFLLFFNGCASLHKVEKPNIYEHINMKNKIDQINKDILVIDNNELEISNGVIWSYGVNPGDLELDESGDYELKNNFGIDSNLIYYINNAGKLKKYFKSDQIRLKYFEVYRSILYLDDVGFVDYLKKNKIGDIPNSDKLMDLYLSEIKYKLKNNSVYILFQNKKYILSKKDFYLYNIALYITSKLIEVKEI